MKQKDNNLLKVCEYGPVNKVISLLEKGANINAKNDDEYTPLHLACKYQPSIVPILIKHGANINAKSVLGDTPLHYACRHQPSVVPILLKHGANVNATDVNNATPLYYACRYQPSVISILLEHGANVNIIASSGWSPFHIVCRDNPSFVSIFLEHGADVNAKDMYDTPLYFACRDNPSVVPILLEYGADVNIKIDRDGNTSFDTAYSRNPFLVPFLVPYLNEKNAKRNINKICRLKDYNSAFYLYEKFKNSGLTLPSTCGKAYKKMIKTEPMYELLKLKQGARAKVAGYNQLEENTQSIMSNDIRNDQRSKPVIDVITNEGLMRKIQTYLFGGKRHSARRRKSKTRSKRSKTRKN